MRNKQVTFFNPGRIMQINVIKIKDMNPKIYKGALKKNGEIKNNL